MDHRQFIATLSTRDRAFLTQPSDSAGLAQLALHWGAIALVGTLIAVGVLGWPLLMVLQGILIVFLFTLLHETAHYTPFKTRWLNDAIGAVCGFVILMEPHWFRYFHLAHHRHTQDPARDPELAEPKPATLGQYVLHVSGGPIWVSQVRALLRNAFGRDVGDYVPDSKRAKVIHRARLWLVGYTGVALVCWGFELNYVIYVWVIPLLLGQPFLRLYLLAEHGGCPQVANMFENTRTTYTAWLVRKLAWNMPYHAEHHAYPTVPFYQLPELHKRARAHLLVTNNGYLRFNQAYVAGLGRSDRPS